MVSPEAMHIDGVQGDERSSRDGSGEPMSDQGGKTSRSGSGVMPSLQVRWLYCRFQVVGLYWLVQR